MLHECKMRVTIFFFLPDTNIMQDKASDGAGWRKEEREKKKQGKVVIMA